MKFSTNNKIYFLFFFISFISLGSVVGFNNIYFGSTEWLHQGNDSTLPQLGWHFFKNDVWRFPLGSNPNYGDELGSSIVFADSIPILSLIFKSLRFFLPENFQYISFWYFICFYLQLFFSYKILEKFTNSVLYSFIGSIFFLVTPILLWKLQIVPALTGQWILLLTLYLGLSRRIEKSRLLWMLLIVLSSLINFYFMVMILGSYSLLRVINFKLNKEHIFQFAKDFVIILSILLLTLYTVGYFEVRMVDTLAVGFGRDKLNLLGIFDSTNTADNLSFSWILPDLKHSYGEETEGFNFFGLGQIIIVLFAFSLFFNKNYKINLQSIKNNKEIKAFFIISLFFTLWALSNKISLGPYTLIEIPLNKYIFGILSIVRPTGRLFWVVNYFLLALSLIIIFKCFDKKKSIAIISFLLIIQIADTSAGIKQRLNLFMPVDNNRLLGDKIWKDLFAKYKIVKTTYPKNYSGLFHKFSYSLEKYNIEKTNLVKLARVNRKAVADAKYNLYKIFRQKKLPSDTLYVIDNLGQLRHLKYIFADENVGFFYRDNVWVMAANERELMNVNDEKALGEIKPKLLESNDKKNLNIGETDNYYGFGWSHNFGNSGIWSEGSISTILFRHDRDNEDLILEAACRPYLAKNNNILEFEIYVNNSFNKKMKLTNKNQDEILKILIKGDSVENNEVKIDFKFKNPISPFEVLESPDSRKLGILLKSIKINTI